VDHHGSLVTQDSTTDGAKRRHLRYGESVLVGGKVGQGRSRGEEEGKMGTVPEKGREKAYEGVDEGYGGLLETVTGRGGRVSLLWEQCGALGRGKGGEWGGAGKWGEGE